MSLDCSMHTHLSGRAVRQLFATDRNVRELRFVPISSGSIFKPVPISFNETRPR